MNIDRVVFMFAGVVTLMSVVLGYYITPYWFVLTGFAGLNMIQSAFTGFCPLAILLRKVGIKSGAAFK